MGAYPIWVYWRRLPAAVVSRPGNGRGPRRAATHDDWRGWQIELAGLDAHWVRVQIDLDLLEAREQARSDRMPGHARSQYHDAYRHPSYDAEVDTGVLDPDAAAAAVLQGWRSRKPTSGV